MLFAFWLQKWYNTFCVGIAEDLGFIAEQIKVEKNGFASQLLYLSSWYCEFRSCHHEDVRKFAPHAIILGMGTLSTWSLLRNMMYLGRCVYKAFQLEFLDTSKGTRHFDKSWNEWHINAAPALQFYFWFPLHLVRGCPQSFTKRNEEYKTLKYI